MRIIHLVRATTWGGGERYAKDLCDRSADDGHNVTVFSRGIPEIDRRFEHPDIELRRLPLGGIFDFVSPLKLARYIDSLPDDEIFVHVHNFKDAAIVARAKHLIRNHKKLILICTRHLVKRGKTSSRWKRIYSAIDGLIFVSELAKSEFLSSSPPIDTGKISVIHNSILIPENSPYIPTAPHPEIRLLYTGRISEEKGIDVLIKSLTMLENENIRLTIAGTGTSDMISSLRRLALRLGVSDKIEWTGFKENVFDAIAESDICIAPSKWREPFGLTIIEFMSQGKPVISTSNGAQKEIITDGIDGLLVEPDDPRALAEAIRTLSSDHNLRLELARHAAATFETRFSYRIFYSRILNAYKQASLPHQ